MTSKAREENRKSLQLPYGTSEKVAISPPTWYYWPPKQTLTYLSMRACVHALNGQVKEGILIIGWSICNPLATTLTRSNHVGTEELGITQGKVFLGWDCTINAWASFNHGGTRRKRSNMFLDSSWQTWESLHKCIVHPLCTIKRELGTTRRAKKEEHSVS